MNRQQFSFIFKNMLVSNKTGNKRQGVRKYASFLYPVFSFAIILGLCFAFMIIENNDFYTFAAATEPVSGSGVLTGSLNWSYDSTTHTYTISGSGTIPVSITTNNAIFESSVNSQASYRAYVENIVFSGSGHSIEFPNDSKCMFCGCAALKSVSIGTIDTSNVTNMQQMFSGCTSLADISFLNQNWSFSSCTTLKQMFNGCIALVNVDAFNNRSDLNSITSIDGMFQGCTGLETLKIFNGSNGHSLDMSKLSTFNTSTTTYFLGATYIEEIEMFNYCDISTLSLTTTLLTMADKNHLTKITAFNNSSLNIATCLSFFASYSKLEYADVFNNDTLNNLTTCKSVFNGCSSLVDVKAFNNCELDKLNSMEGMFNGCTSLTVEDNTQHIFKIFKNSNFGTSFTMLSMFQGCRSIVTLDDSNDSECDIFEDVDISNCSSFASMFSGCTNLYSVNILNNGEKIYITTNDSMFNGCTSLRYIYAFNNIELAGAYAVGTSFITGCTALEEVTYMNGVYKTGSSTITFDSSVLSPAKSSLLNITAFNNMQTDDGYSGFDPVNVMPSTFKDFFKDYSKLVTVNVFNYDKESNINQDHTFGKLNNSTTTTFATMFSGCSDLQTVEIFKNFDFSAVTTALGMFLGCSDLNDYSFLYDIDFRYVYNFDCMFLNNKSMSSMDLSWLEDETQSTTANTFKRMFDGCTNLSTFKWGSASTWNRTDLSYMFYQHPGGTTTTTAPTYANDTTGLLSDEDCSLRYIDLSTHKNIINYASAFRNNKNLLYIKFYKESYFRDEVTYTSQGPVLYNTIFNNAFDYTDLIQLDNKGYNYPSASGSIAMAAPIKKINLYDYVNTGRITDVGDAASAMFPSFPWTTSITLTAKANYTTYRVININNRYDREVQFATAQGTLGVSTSDKSAILVSIDSGSHFDYASEAPIYFDRDELKVYYNNKILFLETGATIPGAPQVFKYKGITIGYLYSDGVFVYEYLPAITGLSQYPDVTKEDLAKIKKVAFVFNELYLGSEDIPHYNDYNSSSIDNLVSNMPNCKSVDFSNLVVASHISALDGATTVFTNSNSIEEIVVPDYSDKCAYSIPLPNRKYQDDIFDYYGYDENGNERRGPYKWLTNTSGWVTSTDTERAGISYVIGKKVYPSETYKLKRTKRVFKTKRSGVSKSYTIEKDPSGEIVSDSNLKYVWNLTDPDSTKDYKSNIYALYFSESGSGNDDGFLVFTGYGDNIKYDENNLPPWHALKDDIAEIQFAGFTPTHMDYFFYELDLANIPITNGYNMVSEDPFDESLLESASHLYDSTPKNPNVHCVEFTNARNLTDISYMFANMTDDPNLVSKNYMIPNPDSEGNLPKLNMEGLFYNNTGITSYDMSSYNVKVTNASKMFEGCTNLTSLNLSGLDFSELEESCDDMFDITVTEVMLPVAVNIARKVTLPVNAGLGYYLYNSMSTLVSPSKQLYLTAKEEDPGAVKISLGSATSILISDTTKIEIESVPDEYWTGSEIKPTVVVRDISETPKTLVAGEDYNVSYSNNTDVGEATITITGTGNPYSGSTVIKFNIKRKIDFNHENDFIMQKVYDEYGLFEISKVYDGTKTVLFGGVTDTEELTFTHDDLDLIPEGVTLTVTGIYDSLGYAISGAQDIILTYEFDGDDYIPFNTNNKVSGYITKRKVAVDSATVFGKVYDGNTKTKILSVTLDKSNVLEADKASVNVSINVFGDFSDENVGDHIPVTIDQSTIYLTGNANYELDLDSLSGLHLKGRITPKELTYELSSLDKDYDGTNTKEVTATITSGVCKKGLFIDDVQINNPLTLVYSNSMSATYTLGGSTHSLELSPITLKGDSARNYTVTQPDSLTGTIRGFGFALSGVTITDGPFTYTGSEIKPTVSVVDSEGNPMIKDKDYSVSYSNNIDATSAGTFGEIIITGLGKYAESSPVTKTFEIYKKALEIDLSDNKYLNDLKDTKVYDGDIELSVTTKTVKVAGASNETINLALTGTYDNKNASSSSYDKTITFSEDLSLSAVTKSNDIVYSKDPRINYDITVINKSVAYSGFITRKNLSDISITYNNGQISKEYTGSLITLLDSELNVKDTAILDAGDSYSLINGTDFEVIYTNNKDISTNEAVATITGLGNYTGSITKNFSITGCSINAANIEVTKPSDIVYTGSNISLPTSDELKVYDTNKGAYLTPGEDYEIRFKNGSYKDAGDVDVIIKGIGNYFEERTVTYHITKKKLLLSDIEIPSEIASKVKVKDGTNRASSDIVTFSNSELVPFVNYNGEIVKFTFEKAYISDTSGDPIYIARETDSTKTLRNIAITKLAIKNNDSSFNSNNYLLVEDPSYNFAYTNASPYVFEDKSYLIDDVTPKVTNLRLKDQDTVKTYGDGQTIEFVIYVSEELNIDTTQMSSYTSNVKLTYTLTNGIDTNNYDIYLTSVDEIDAGTKSGRATVLRFTGTVPTLTTSVYTFGAVTLSDESHVLVDFAGNELDTSLVNDDFTYKYDFTGIKVDQTGFTVNITKDVTGNSTINKDITFMIDLSSVSLNAIYTDDESILENFYLRISDGSDPTISDEYTLDDVLNDNVTGTSVEVVSTHKYKVTIDTYLMGLIGLNDTPGKYITLGIDENKLLDVTGSNHNIEQASSILLLRTINDFDLSFIQNGINHLVYDDTNNILLDGLSEEVMFYDGDVLTIITNKVISSTNAFISFVTSLGGSYDSKTNFYTDRIELSITDSMTISNLIEYFDNYATNISNKLLVRIKVRKQNDVIKDFNDGIKSIINSSDYSLLSKVLTNKKDIELLDSASSLGNSDITDITNVSGSVSSITGTNTILLDEIVRRYQNEKSNAATNERFNSQSASEITSTLLEVANSIIDMEEVLSTDYSSDNDEGIIDYENNPLWIKKLVEDSNNAMISTLQDNKLTSESGYVTSAETSANERVELFGLSSRLNNSGAKVKVKAEKKLNETSLAAIKTYMTNTLSVPQSEKIISVYDISLVDKANESVKYNVLDPSKKVLVSFKLPKEFAGTILNVYHKDGDDSSFTITKIDDEDVLVTTLNDELLVNVLASSFSDYIITSSSGTLTVIESGNSSGGYTADTGIYSLKGLSEKDIYVIVNTGYTAEIYKDGSKVATLASSGNYKLTSMSASSNILLDVKFVKNPDPEPAPSGGGGGTKTIIKEVEVFVTPEPVIEDVIMHKAFMNGYEDHTFKPNSFVSREEVATIVARIFEDFDEGTNYLAYNNFVDAKDRWAKNYIGFCKYKGLINGYEDGTFVPQASMTRAELATLVSKFDFIQNAEVNDEIEKVELSDIEGEWYEEAVTKLASLGILNGYEDGKFKGQNYVTRVEVAIVMNKVQGRAVTVDSIPYEYLGRVVSAFKDVREYNWFFKDVAEATVDHPADSY